MVFRISLAIIAALVLWGIASPAGMATTTSTWLAATTQGFGWYYLLVVFGILVFALWLALGRYGHIRFGGEEAQPEFSTSAWFAMLFSAGMGIGLVFWGVAEPLTHFLNPPGGLASGTPEAARAAMRSVFFHWGLHPWALYAVVGAALAFFKFNRGAPALLSAAFRPLFGHHVDGWLGKVIDVLAVVATSIGVATSLGFGAKQIAHGLSHVFGLPSGEWTLYGVVVLSTGLFVLSSVTGLARGVKWLSGANMLLAFILLLAVFLFGPTLFALDIFTATLGSYLNGIISQSMHMTPFTQGTWVSDWTVFYWAWWMTWAPFVGMFIARISRGRSLREFMFGVLVIPSMVSFLWFAIMGGAALHRELFDGLNIAATVSQQPDSALYALLDTLPLAKPLAVVTILLVMSFFVSSADSATFVLGMMSSQGRLNPSVHIKVVWGVAMAAIALVLLQGNGLKALATMSILSALPFTLVLVGLCFSLANGLKLELRNQELRDRELRRRLRDMADQETAVPNPAGDGQATASQASARRTQ